MKRVEQIAQIAHETNRAYCSTIGDNSQVPWAAAPEWQRNSAIAGVEFALKNPDATPADSHESWLAVKRSEGWSYGAVKDPQKKEHPCFLTYEELPGEQRLKDSLFQAVVRAMV